MRTLRVAHLAWVLLWLRSVWRGHTYLGPRSSNVVPVMGALCGANVGTFSLARQAPFVSLVYSVCGALVSQAWRMQRRIYYAAPCTAQTQVPWAWLVALLRCSVWSDAVLCVRLILCADGNALSQRAASTDGCQVSAWSHAAEGCCPP